MAGKPSQWKKPVIRTCPNLHPRQRDFVYDMAKRDGISYSCALRRIIDYAIDCANGRIPSMDERLLPMAKALMERLERDINEADDGV